MSWIIESFRRMKFVTGMIPTTLINLNEPTDGEVPRI